MFGIAGTDFWGFGSGFSDGGVMIGGTYHNATLLKDNDTYVQGDSLKGTLETGDGPLSVVEIITGVL